MYDMAVCHTILEQLLSIFLNYTMGMLENHDAQYDIPY